MFGFLKKKLAEVAESISEKMKKKTEKDLEQEARPQVEEEQAEIIQEAKVEISKITEEKISEIEAAPEKEPEMAEEKVAAAPEAKPQKKEKKSFIKRLTERVTKKITEKKLSPADVTPMLGDIQVSLMEADVAYEVAEKIGSDLRAALVDREIKRGKEKEIILESFRKSLLGILDVPKIDIGSIAGEKKPVLLVFWGFNGSGKTTSLAKTASWLIKKGHTCVFAAADTFRAAAEEQLEHHAEKIGVKLIKHKYGADPAAVIFDAVEHAKAKGIDFVLADTAGRAHTNANLMDQMRKIVRVNKPDVKILVIDSLVGNDALDQARMYGEVGVDAVIFTKIDVNEKGGAILSVTHEIKKPILFLGLGQHYSHLEEFDAKKFVDNILF